MADPAPLHTGDPFLWGLYADHLLEEVHPQAGVARLVYDTLLAFAEHGKDTRRLLLSKLKPRPFVGRTSYAAFDPRKPKQYHDYSFVNRDHLWVHPVGASDFYRLGITQAEAAARSFRPWELVGFTGTAPDATWSYFRKLAGEAGNQGWVRFDNSSVTPACTT